MKALLCIGLLGLVCQAVDIRFLPASDEVLAQRLAAVSDKNEERAETVRQMLESAGCKDLRLQPAKGKWNNIVCTLPGKTDDIVVIGAHYDHAAVGMGVVDNWGGVSLLPSLYEMLAKDPRRFTYVFVGFAEEEKGMVGAKAYVKQLGKAGLAKVHAMINIDSIGMNPPKIWVSRGDRRLVAIAAAVGEAFGTGLQGVDVQQVGDSDSRPFAEEKTPVLDVHSVTQETLRVLHSKNDTPEAVKFEHYKSTYRFLSGVLVYIDAAFHRYETPQPQKPSN